VAEHTDGRVRRVPLTPDRPVGDVTRDLLGEIRAIAGDVTIATNPQEVAWTVPLDEDREHATYEPERVSTYFSAAARAALVLEEFRAPYRGRSTQVNAWWGSFDLSVNLFSGLPADPPADDFITRNSMDLQEIAIGWWPGDARFGDAAFYGYAHPAPDDFADASLSPAGTRWDGELGLYVLDWEDARATRDPHGTALEFAHSEFNHASDA